MPNPASLVLVDRRSLDDNRPQCDEIALLAASTTAAELATKPPFRYWPYDRNLNHRRIESIEMADDWAKTLHIPIVARIDLRGVDV